MPRRSGAGTPPGKDGTMIRTLAFIVLVISFIHVSILVGTIEKTPLVGPAVKAGMAQDDRIYVSIPMKIYGAAGGLLWKNETLAGVIKELYSKISKEGIQRLKPKEFKGIFNIYFWNKVALVSLGVFLALSVLGRRRG